MKKGLLIILLLVSSIVWAEEVGSNAVTPVTYFVNHVQQLIELRTNLRKYKQTSVVGTSGMGKTQLVRMYTHEDKNNYNLIWYFDCNLDIDEEFLRLAQNINKIAATNIISENITSVKKDVMSYLTHKDKWLLVFDNLKIKGNSRIQDLVNWEHNGNVIFCSQDSEQLPHVINMTVLRNNDIITLAHNILDAPDANATQFLIQEFRGYPMLIVQGAQLLKTIKGLNPEEYKKKLYEVTDKIELNIELAINNLSESAKNLLYKIALINNQRFSKELVGVFADAIATMDDDLYQLSKFVLISCIDTNAHNPIFEMHDVIAQTVRKINGDKKNQYYLDEIISKLVKSIPEGIYKAHIFRNAKTIQENLAIILQNAQIYQSNIHKIMELNLHLLGNYSNASDFYNAAKMVRWFEERDQNGEFILAVMNNHEKGIYAGYLGTIGTYNRKRLSNHNIALKYYNKAAEVFEVVSGRESWKFNLSYLAALSNISLGYIQEANHNINKLETIALNGLVDEGDLGLIQRIRAKLKYYQGNYDEALIAINDGIAQSIKHGVNPNDKVFTTPYIFKAMILNALQKYQEAYIQIGILQEMHKSSKKVDHLVYGRIFTQMARAELGQKKIKEAMNHITQAITILLADEIRNPKNANFSEDEDLAESYVVQGDILSTQDHFQTAIESYRKAQGIYFYLYKERSKNIAHVSYLYTQGAKTSCKAKDLYHYKCFGQAQVEEFGIDHPNTVAMFLYCEPYHMNLWGEED